jgi:hypothetical protein
MGREATALLDSGKGLSQSAAAKALPRERELATGNAFPRREIRVFQQPLRRWPVVLGGSVGLQSPVNWLGKPSNNDILHTEERRLATRTGATARRHGGVLADTARSMAGSSSVFS